jgi:hypothetical protein
MSNSCIVFVFSYNRGSFLANAVASVEKQMAGVSLVIIDDHSEDHDTKVILARLREKYPVLSPERHQENSVKHGGLYACMNLAMRTAEDQGACYAVFLQDDMQLVRRWQEKDWERVDSFFAGHQEVAQMSLIFFKHDDRGRRDRYTISDEGIAYFRLEEDWRNIAFSDTGIFHLQRIRAVLPCLPAGELTADRRMRQEGYRLGFYAFPLMMFLPLPPTWRGKRRSPFCRLAEALGRVGFYPYEPMREGEVSRLLGRSLDELPIGDEWLEARGLPDCRVVTYEGKWDARWARMTQRLSGEH